MLNVQRHGIRLPFKNLQSISLYTSCKYGQQLHASYAILKCMYAKHAAGPNVNFRSAGQHFPKILNFHLPAFVAEKLLLIAPTLVSNVSIN